jgi:hypothetical protein
VLSQLYLRGRGVGRDANAAAAACFAGLVGLMASLTTTSYGRNETTYIMLLAAGAGLLSRAWARSSVATLNVASIGQPAMTTK